MSSFRDRPYLRFALIATLVASLGLAACGRKGPLDLPPGTSSAEESNARAAAERPANPIMSPIGSSETKTENTGFNSEGKPQAPKGPNKRIPLDGLLN